ncbi:MAG: FtsW/RodA/SpoVE family cell cycle protein, partial [Bacteroidia bacterium]|nr:FtsW/RodA/SpoVE family cell cycle protein [Bacteroidia bacterium]
MTHNWLHKYFKGDRYIWLIVFFMSLVSVLAVYSSIGTLAYKYQSGNTEYYLFKHLIILIFGIGLMYAAHLVRYTHYTSIAQIGILVAIPLLIFTLLSGTNLNEASRWLTLPIINLTFQTSDLAKLVLIMYVARMLSKKQENIKDFKTAFLPIMIPVIIICGLILPANFSTAAVLFVTCLFLMYIGRINLKYIMMMIGIGALCLTIFISIALMSKNQGRVATWKARVENFMNKGDSDGTYQTQQAKIAIATGGLLGKGPGNSTQRNFLPHPYSDFIYAIIIEEYGLVGGITMVMIYLILFFRVIRFVRMSPRGFATLLAIGCSFSLVFQAMINMAVAVNLFPVTGQPLPMLSMGGTSIWFTSIAIGIILSISKEVIKENENGEP